MLDSVGMNISEKPLNPGALTNKGIERFKKLSEEEQFGFKQVVTTSHVRMALYCKLRHVLI
jgi:hypothetical protein